jgi:hypothetical protein
MTLTTKIYCSRQYLMICISMYVTDLKMLNMSIICTWHIFIMFFYYYLWHFEDTKLKSCAGSPTVSEQNSCGKDIILCKYCVARFHRKIHLLKYMTEGSFPFILHNFLNCIDSFRSTFCWPSTTFILLNLPVHQTISQCDLNTPDLVYNRRQLVGTEPDILANNVVLNRTAHRWPYKRCENNFLS